MDKRKIKNKNSHFFELGSNIFTWDEQDKSGVESYLNSQNNSIIRTHGDDFDNGEFNALNLDYGVKNIDVKPNNTDTLLTSNPTVSRGGGNVNTNKANWGNLNVGAIVAGGMGMAESMSSSFNDLKNTEVQHDTPIDVSGANDYDTLQNFSNGTTRRKIGFTEVGGHTTGQSWKNVGKGAGAGAGVGATIGSVVGPIGTVVGGAIGAVVGGAGTAIAEAFGHKKAKNKQLAEQRKADELYNIQENNMANQANNIALNEIANQQWDYLAALGGNLHSNSTTWSNGLNYIGAGGSHESNPNDGVAISTAPDGLQNKVEEGEVVWDNEYVFSKRLKVPESVKKKNKWKGSTFADVAKELMENSEERPNDPIALRGLDDSLSRLRDAQDELKAKQEERKIKKEIASMPPELLAQMQQAQQQPTEEEMAQQAAIEQQQMAMADSSMQQPMVEQPQMYAKGGSVKAVSSAGLFMPAPTREFTGIGNNGEAQFKTETDDAYNERRNQAVIDYINRQSNYVNIDDAQKYGGFYTEKNANLNSNVDDKLAKQMSFEFNKENYGKTPMNIKNVSEGVSNQINKENKVFYKSRLPFKENNTTLSLAASPKDVKYKKTAYVLDKNDPNSVNFFKSKNKNLNFDDPNTIYYFSQDRNDRIGRNRGKRSTDRITKDIINNNNVENLSNMSGINWNRLQNTGLKAKGGHLHAYDPDLNFANQKQAYYANPYNDSLTQYEIYKNIQQDRDAKRMSQMNQGYDLTNYKDAYTNEFNRDYALQKEIENAQLNKRNSYLTQDYDLSDYKSDYRDRLNRADASGLNNLDFLQPGTTGVRNAAPFSDLQPLQSIDFLDKYKLGSSELLRPDLAARKEAGKDLLKQTAKDARREKLTNLKNNIGEKIGNINFDETDLRYAPVLAGIWQNLRDLGRRPDYSNPKAIERAAARVAAPVSAERIGDYLQYRPLDDTYYLNQLNAQQNAANNNIIGLSNGNRSMALASMLANDYNYNNQRGAAYRQGAEYNDINRLKVGEFNRGTNQFNAQQAMQASLANAQNRANAANLTTTAAQMRENIDNAFGASKSANFTNLFNNIGNVGRDRMNWNMAKDIYDYQVGRNGEVKYKNAAKGGYLTIKTKNRRIE